MNAEQPAVPAPRSVPSPLDLPARRIPGQRPAPNAEMHTDTEMHPDAETHPGIRDAARSQVLHSHARLTTRGRPVFCTPSREEIAGVVALRQGRGTDGKVIYDTRDAAEAAARGLEALGARALRSYLCGRSRSGHFHLATDTAHTDTTHTGFGHPLTPAEVHARIPRQRGPLSA